MLRCTVINVISLPVVKSIKISCSCKPDVHSLSRSIFFVLPLVVY